MNISSDCGISNDRVAWPHAPMGGREPTMLTFENDDYKWRETYFVLFDSGKRPTLAKIASALRKLNARFELINMAAEDEDAFDSLTLHSPQDYAAMDIS